MLFGQMATRTRMMVFTRRNNRANSIVISLEKLGKFLPGFFSPDSFISYLCLCIHSLTQTLTMKWKEKLGNYLIDISKYFLTGVLITALIEDLRDLRWMIYALSGSIAILSLISGLVLTSKEKEE